MPKQLDFNQIEIEQLEFDLLRLNFTNLTFIHNDTINQNSSTEAFTGHGAVRWRGLFMEAVEDRLVVAAANLLLITHPPTHPATLITETTDRVWFTPAEHTKLLGIESNANLFIHPSNPTHTLDDISDSDTRVMFLSHERTKLTDIEEGANFYAHPEFHDMSDFDGLLDGDGYLNFDWTSYTYSSFRYGVLRAVTFSLGGTSEVVDSVNNMDFIAYVGTGLTTPTPLPFRVGFNHNSPHGMFIFSNDSDVEGFNLHSTLNPMTLRFPTQAPTVGGVYFSNVLSVSGDGVSLTNSSSTLIDRINNSNNNYRVLGIKTNSETLLYPETGLLDPEIIIDWVNHTKFKFELQRMISTTNSAYKTHLFKINSTLYSISTPANQVAHVFSRITGASVVELQSLPKLYNSGEVYVDDYSYTSSGGTNYGRNNVLYVEYDTLTIGGVGFKIWKKLSSATVFSSSTGLHDSYKKDSLERVIQVSICKFSEVIEANQSATYFITILSSNGSTSWVRIYYTIPVNNNLTHWDTTTINYNVYGCAMSYNICASFYGNDSRANFVLMAYNSQLVLYGVGYSSDSSIWVVHTMASPRPFSTTNCIKADPLHGNRFVITYGDRIYIYEFTIVYGGALSGYPTASNVTLSEQIYTNGNHIQFHTNGMVTGDSALAGTQFSRVSVVDVASRRIYQSIITKDIIAPTSCAFTVDSATSLQTIVVSNPFSGFFLQYILSSLRFETNIDIGFAMWNHRVPPVAVNVPNPIGKKPILIFTYSESGFNPGLTLLYGNRWSSVLSSEPTLMGSTNTTVYPNGDQSLNVLTYQTASTISYSSGVPGGDVIYFGWFGDEYQVTTDLGVKTAYGIPGTTLIMEVLPGEIIQTGMIPNVIMFKYTTEMYQDYLNVTGSSIGFDMYERLGQSSLQGDRPVTVNGEAVSFSGITTMLVLIMGADTHSVGTSLTSDITTSNPLMTTFKGSRQQNFDWAANAGSNVKGERDSFINFTSDIAGTYSILPPTPVGLNINDSRYLCLNSMGIIHYNKENTTLPAQWDTPDEMIYGNYTALTNVIPLAKLDHIPLAKVNFQNGSITDVVHYPVGDSYQTEWRVLNLYNEWPYYTVLWSMPNRFMTTAIVISAQIVNNPAEPVVGFEVPFQNDNISTTSSLIAHGLKISFTPNIITVSQNREESSFFGTGTESCMIRLTIKRLF